MKFDLDAVAFPHRSGEQWRAATNQPWRDVDVAVDPGNVTEAEAMTYWPSTRVKRSLPVTLRRTSARRLSQVHCGDSTALQAGCGGLAEMVEATCGR
jgi:hypothetical protein